MVGAAAPVAGQSAEPGYVLTSQVRAGAEQARQAIAQMNYPAASASLNQINANVRTNGDRYVLASLQLDIANRTFNTAAQVAAINALMASPLVSELQRAELYYHRARISYHAQNVPAARTDLQAAIDRGSTNPRVFIAMAGLMSEAADHAGALGMFDRAIAIQRTAGIATPVNWYRRALDLAQRGSNQPRVLLLSQDLARSYPTVRNWRDAAILHRTAFASDPQISLDLWRLQAATGALTGEVDYRTAAGAANTAGQGGDAVRLIEMGRSNSMLDGSNAAISALLRTANRTQASTRSAIAGRAAAAQSAATGANALAVADNYLGLAQYTEAATFYRLSLEKGGVDADHANSRLGIALALSGQADGARSALDAVTGNRAAVARLWRAYVDSRPVVVPTAGPVSTGN
jgi:tetratricopeptide (TPR) repeat protein